MVHDVRSNGARPDEGLEASLSPRGQDTFASESADVRTPSPTGPAVERRHAPRRKVLKAGKVIFGDKRATDCSIRNISDAGACLEINDPRVVTQIFELKMVQQEFSRTCRLLWEQNGRIGVTFLKHSPDI